MLTTLTMLICLLVAEYGEQQTPHLSKTCMAESLPMREQLLNVHQDPFYVGKTYCAKYELIAAYFNWTVKLVWKLNLTHFIWRLLFVFKINSALTESFSSIFETKILMESQLTVYVFISIISLVRCDTRCITVFIYLNQCTVQLFCLWSVAL